MHEHRVNTIYVPQTSCASWIQRGICGVEADVCAAALQALMAKDTQGRAHTLRVEPRNWMPLNASALLASCTLRSLMNAYGGPLSRVMLQFITELPLSS